MLRELSNKLGKDVENNDDVHIYILLLILLFRKKFYNMQEVSEKLQRCRGKNIKKILIGFFQSNVIIYLLLMNQMFKKKLFNNYPFHNQLFLVTNNHFMLYFINCLQKNRKKLVSLLKILKNQKIIKM